MEDLELKGKFHRKVEEAYRILQPLFETLPPEELVLLGGALKQISEHLDMTRKALQVENTLLAIELENIKKGLP